jgi:cytoskeleton protein RodZ
VVLAAAVAGVVCAVGIVLWAVWPDVKVSEPAAATQPAGPAEVSIPKPAQAEAPTEETEPQMTSDATSPSNASVVATSATVAAPVSHDDQGAHRITSDGHDRLKFAFTDECWVEIKDARGSSIYSDLSESGDSLELVGKPPFHILLGNAPAVTLAFNGERVALSPHTRNNVGTLVLGQ